MLNEILAKIDALFLPTRWPELEARRALHEARDRFAQDGLLWRIGGDAAARQRGARELEATAASGRLIVNRPPGRQSAYVRLPEHVEDELREAACVATYATAEPLLGAMAANIADGRHRAAQALSWVHERDLTDAAGDDSDRMLAILSETMLPLLVRGRVVANADIHGHVWYAIVTPEAEQRGQELAGEPWPDEVHTPDRATRATYLKAMNAEWGRLRHLRPKRTNEIAPIPMAASG